MASACNRTLQIIRDWVIKFNALGPEGLIDRKPPGRQPRHPVNRRDRAALDDRLQRRAALVVQARLRSRRLAIDQTVGAARIELQRPVADDLQRHPANPRSLGARRAFVDRRQRQQSPSPRPVLRTLRRALTLEAS